MLSAFTASFLLISISELGDKSFFVAMILAMRYPRRWVLAGVLAALTSMTVISISIGRIISFLPPNYLHYGKILIFLAFGIKLLLDAWQMKANATVEIIEEAEEAIEQEEKHLKPSQGRRWGTFLEAFTLTFVGEWGDRTQIATVALAASQNVVGVAVGAIAGYTITALIAVLGGKWIAGRISEKVVTVIGGLLFFIFAGVAYIDGP